MARPRSSRDPEPADLAEATGRELPQWSLQIEQRIGPLSGNDMSLSPALIADLEELTAYFDPPNTQLSLAIQHLEAAALIRVGSLMAWTFTVILDGMPLMLTSIQPTTQAGEQVRASLQVPFPLMSGNPAEVVVLYASQVGAFGQFAVDVAGALHVDAAEVVLDGDLDPILIPGINGLNRWRAFNRALGKLLGRKGELSGAGHPSELGMDVVDLAAYRAARNISDHRSSATSPVVPER